ncbi:MAG: hypothetical protein WC028_27650 [Candidatus Obscuribacterales bacterium]|jgi:hypothetical protein
MSLRLKIAISCFTIACVNLAGHSGNAALAQGAQFDTASILSAAAQGLGLTSGRQPLPVVSTGSVDINSCDMPFLRSAGGSGAFPSSSGSGNGSGGPGSGNPITPAPALPPGYVGMTNTHSGDYMGYIPPGGNLYDWSRGAYGLTPGQEAEATYLWSSGQLAQGYNSGMFAGTGISLGGP